MIDIYYYENPRLSTLKFQINVNHRKYVDTANRLKREEEKVRKKLLRAFYDVNTSKRYLLDIYMDMKNVENEVGIVDVKLSAKMRRAGVDYAAGIDCGDNELYHGYVFHAKDGWYCVTEEDYSSSSYKTLLAGRTARAFLPVVLELIGVCSEVGYLTEAQAMYRSARLKQGMEQAGEREDD